MKIRDGFMLRNVDNTNIVVPVGDIRFKFNKLITLNDSSTFVWNLLQNDITFDEVLSSLIENYDVDADTAKNDINIFLQALEDCDLLIK